MSRAAHGIKAALLGALYFYGPSVAADNLGACPVSDEQFFSQLSKARDWAAFYSMYQINVLHCPDDGFYAEGYSDRVVYLLANRWSDLPTLSHLIQSDQEFRVFVYRHIDATADTDELKRLQANAQYRCPTGSFAICQALARSAKVALADANSSQRYVE